MKINNGMEYWNGMEWTKNGTPEWNGHGMDNGMTETKMTGLKQNKEKKTGTPNYT